SQWMVRELGSSRKLAMVTAEASQLGPDWLPRMHPINSSRSKVNEPFFVFGSGRNGSTLLNLMLNMHPELFLPSEQYFLGDSIIKYKLYNFLNWRDLMKIIVGELLTSAKKHTWDISTDDMFERLLNLEEKSLESVIETIYRSYGDKITDFSIWGDTTPSNTAYIPEIFSLFPKSKYIFLIRDGRDVVASHKNAGEFVKRFSEPKLSANLWIESIGYYDWLKSKCDVLLVKYEDLVNSPESILKAISDHLGIEYVDQYLNFHQHKPTNLVYKEPVFDNIDKPLFNASIGRYSQDLSGTEIANVTSAMHKHLLRFEYL
ncbi:MAG: sulfotransferase, partial [Bacteroidota bacterium]